jgi:beta-galactosidase
VRRAVELETSSVAHARHDPRSGTLIIKKGSPTSVTAGNATFVFDPATGHLTSASNGNQPRVYGMRPTIWRPMNHTEMIIVKAEKGVQSLPDLNRYTPSVKTWTITEQADRPSFTPKWITWSIERIDSRLSMTMQFEPAES